MDRKIKKIAKHHVGENIQFLRKKLSITQQQLAQFISSRGCPISQDAISNYEQRYYEPPIDRLKAIADFFGITIDDLCFKNFNHENKSIQIDPAILPGV